MYIHKSNKKLKKGHNTTILLLFSFIFSNFADIYFTLTTQMRQDLKQYLLLIVFILTSVHNALADAEHTPFIESLTGSISGNTLTLTATMNYDNIQSQIEGTVKYHWTKDGAAQSGENNVFTDNNAFTPKDIIWQVYATYTYNDEQKQTETVTYIQKKPHPDLNGVINGEYYELTPSLYTNGVEISNLSFFIVTGRDGESITSYEPFGDSPKRVSRINFDGKMWEVYATYTYDGTDYTTDCASIEQEPSTLPTLSVAEAEDQGHTQLTMTATLSNEYDGIISNILYHWTKDGKDQAGHTNTQVSTHSFATQEWTCYATFEHNSNTYYTATETYTYYSTLGHITVKITEDGNNLTAQLFKADEHGKPTEALTLPDGTTVTYEWSDSKATKYTNTTATQAKPTNGAIWIECKATLKDSNKETLEKYEVYRLNADAKVVVFINYTGGGNDSNSGLDYQHPVKTWKKAYQLLPRGGNWDNNIIVVVNGTNSNISAQINDEDTDDKAATITGEWPWEGTKQVTDGRFYLGNDGYVKNNTSRNAYIGAPTKFKNIRMYSIGSQGRLCLMLHDTYFDEGVIMQNFGDLSGNMGETAGRKAPHFHLMLYTDRADTRNFTQNERMNLTIKSGRYGRIMCTRIQGTSTSEIDQRYVVGRYNMPFKAYITIDIPSTNPDGRNSGNSNRGYTDDIALLCAGSTQGTVYADMKFDIQSGRIATLTGGSIGNAISQVTAFGLPVSTFCGRSIINVNGANDDDVKINKLYASTLGRQLNDSGLSATCDAYSYGETTINITHGTVNTGIYATAGGILGYENNGHHTNDPRIPYLTIGGESGNYVRGGISYLPYNSSRTIATMTGMQVCGTADLPLNNSKVEINVSGGKINGGVYGGGQGYYQDMPVQCAPIGAGSLYANSYVNISGGTITGSIYGGGAGATDYYDKAAAGNKSKFTTVASVYGNTNVTITGTPDIRGNIFGAGAGVEATSANEFLEIARVYGTTNVIFNADYTDDNPFRGNIYGGGAHGGVEGNTNVVIKKGVIIGNVFGGSQGQEGYSNKAKVVGTTKVVIGE